VSNLTVGDEVTGTVVRIEDYGVFIQMDGYNRPGLLHIQRVADLYTSFINKKQGLIDAGLEKRSRVKLTVIENDQKRIFLDFTDDVKQIAAEENRQLEIEIERQQNQLREQLQRQRVKPESSISDVSETPADVATTVTPLSVNENDVGSNENYGDDDEEYDENDSGEYDNYDEERDIEDALGLGSY
jgi:predicted RNA-binding protein with RPS1 domain